MLETGKFKLLNFRKTGANREEIKEIISQVFLGAWRGFPGEHVVAGQIQVHIANSNKEGNIAHRSKQKGTLQGTQE